MKRREFIMLLSGAAAAWPVVAWGQQVKRRRRIGILMNLPADDPEGQARLAAFQQGLQEQGWSVGRNVDISIRWGARRAERHKQAIDLVASDPDVLFAGASSSLGMLQQVTKSIPIVFAQVTDPVGGGYVASLARPGGNTTGFSLFEYSVSGKWLELLRQVSPAAKRVLVFRDPALIASIAQFGALQLAAPALGIEVIPANFGNAEELERIVESMARQGDGGMVVTVGASASMNRPALLRLAAEHSLPAVYPFRYYTADGGLMSYGPDTVDQFRRAAGYVDRILKGDNPADLPVQAPTKYELVINLKTAKALGLDVPPMLLARADEVIE